MNPRVRIEIGRQRGQEYEIPPQDEKESVVLGRGTFCDIRIFDMQLSRRHCQFINDGTHLYVEDLGSKNGTMVNGKRIEKRTELEDGDTINVGTSALIVENVMASRGLDRTVKWPGMRTEADRLAAQASNLEGKEFAGVDVEQKIHESPTAIVYKGRLRENGQVCALKLIRPDAPVSIEQKNRFIRGAKYAAQFHHPHVVRVYRGGKLGELYYVIVEYVEGQNLPQLVKESGGALDLQDALHITAQILSALQAAYGKGLVIRSVRPDNIMVGENLNAKITDFELVKPVPTEEEKQVTRIVDGNINVDPSYAAPELIAYPVVADQRADVFGAGTCLYFMLTGSAPFPESIGPDKISTVFFRQMRDPRNINPDIPQSVMDILNKAMAEQPHDRYQTAQEMLEDVEQAQSST